MTARGRISLIIPVIDIAQSIFQKLRLCIQKTDEELVCSFCEHMSVGAREDTEHGEHGLVCAGELSLGMRDGRGGEETDSRGREDRTVGELEGVLRMLYVILPR